VRLIYLQGEHDLIARRLAQRQHHFMPASLLASQLDTLEEPGPDEPAITVDAGLPPDEIAELVLTCLSPSSGHEPG
jgi:gluconate kinase